MAITMVNFPGTMVQEKKADQSAAEAQEKKQAEKKTLTAENKSFIRGAEAGKPARPRGRPRKYKEKRIQSCVYFSESNMMALRKLLEEDPYFSISAFVNEWVEKGLRERGYRRR